MICPNCNNDPMTEDYQIASLEIDGTRYSNRIKVFRCTECGAVVLGDGQPLKEEKTSVEDPAYSVRAQEKPTEMTQNKESDDLPLPEVLEISDDALPDISLEVPEEGVSNTTPAAGEKGKSRIHFFDPKEFRTKGHFLSDEFLDSLELTDDVHRKKLYKELTSFERRQRRHMDRYTPTHKVVIHDTIIDPSICELIKTDEIRVHKKYISKRYYYKSPEGYFFSVAHTMLGKDQANELKLSLVKKLFEDDPDLYKKYIPENQYTEGYDPSKEAPIEEESASPKKDKAIEKRAAAPKVTEAEPKQDPIKEKPRDNPEPETKDTSAKPKKPAVKKKAPDPEPEKEETKETEETPDDVALCETEDADDIELDLPTS